MVEIQRRVSSARLAFRAVANLEYVDRVNAPDGTPVPRELLAEPWNLGDGVRIVGRSQSALKAIGCDDAIIARLFEEWGMFGASSFVIYAESSLHETPESFVLMSNEVPVAALSRAVLAMRLSGPGSVGHGPIHILRPSGFSTGYGGRFGLPA